MSLRKISRRNFLAFAGTAAGSAFLFNPVRQLLNSIFAGQVQQARSKQLGNHLRVHPTRNFVQFNLYGAPARWAFDHVLRPTENDAFLACEGVYNRFQELHPSMPNKNKGAYAYQEIRGINMPHLWQNEVIRGDGRRRPLADLMNHMLVVRGCNTGADGHNSNCARQVSPIPGGYSITGLVGDASGACIPSVAVGNSPANFAYHAPQGTGVVNIPPEHPDYISFLLEPFSESELALVKDKRVLEAELDLALSALNRYTASSNAGSEALYHERKRAQELLRYGVKSLGDAFRPLVEKYEAVFYQSMHLGPIAGVTDKIVPGFPQELSIDTDEEFWDACHQWDGRLICSPDLREMFRNARADYLIKHFALAEFVLLEGLSSSVLLAPPIDQEMGNVTFSQVGPLHYRNYEDYDRSENGIRTLMKANKETLKELAEHHLIHDSHTIGWATNVIACNLFYRGFGACLAELIDQLKRTKLGTGTLFDETVIQVASEYDRYPRLKGQGLNHNSQAHVTSIYSGIIQEPTVLGNVFVGREAKFPFPAGTIGNAAPVAELNGKTIGLENISSTLSAMLRVEKLVPTAPSLVEVKENRVAPTIERAKNVDEHA